ncbi:MAG: ATP-binding protein, partial [Candidatus Pacearchaeota archaeon]|nr:ATP-binding protein [Candidatus Pacearchaeota archaeon]
MTYRIRPSARLISTIGKDLVKDKFAAIVELVKNSYDADATYAYISIEYKEEDKQLSIAVEDDGHGMNLDTVVNTWLVPATPDKLDRKTSKGGRPLQGRKGIGRFAAAVLGTEIYLLSKQDRFAEVFLTLDLKDFSKDKFLEDVPVVIEKGAKGSSKGTVIEATSHNVIADAAADMWSTKEKGKLLTELKKLLAPSEVEKVSKKLGYIKKEDTFSIQIEFKGLPNIDDEIIDIEPFDIVEMYDYRMHGEIDKDGNATLSYFNQNTPSIPEEKITIRIYLEDKISQAYPGKINFDFRVFDRDPESIDELINRGLVDPATGERAGKRKAREILDEYYGVSLYRGMFRIRPYGD